MRGFHFVLAGFAATGTIALSGPASAQCMYVACQGSPIQVTQPQSPPVSAEYGVTQDSQHDAYHAGYVAGRRDAASHRDHHRHTNKGKTSRQVVHSRSKAKRTKSHATAAVRHKSKSGSYTSSRHAAVHSHTSQTKRVSTSSSSFDRRAHAEYDSNSQIRDHARTYGTNHSGSSLNLGSVVSSSSRSVSQVIVRSSWVGPSSTVVQGGQICGWGAQIIHTPAGPQRQSAWLCQCAQGWRPPGY